MSRPSPAARELRQALARGLRAYRQTAGLTQEDLAHQLNVAVRYYGSIERGQMNVTVDTIGRIADHIGLSPFELLRDEN